MIVKKSNMEVITIEKTDINAIINEALTFLYCDLKVDKDMPFIAHHPFFKCPYQYFEGRIQDLRDEKVFRTAQRKLKEKIEKAEEYDAVVSMINRPFLPAFFKHIASYLSTEDYAETLMYVWTMTEFPNQDANVSAYEFVKYFKKADREYLMNEKDREMFDRLPENVNVYRGVGPKGTEKALSWTTEKNIAKWFAKRFAGDEKDCKIFAAEIDKNDIFAYTNERGEKEVILDYKKLKNIREV